MQARFVSDLGESVLFYPSALRSVALLLFALLLFAQRCRNRLKSLRARRIILACVTVHALFSKDKSMFARMREDIRAVFKYDPAAKSVLEVLFCYPGLHAIWVHRLAHWFYECKRYFIARLVSHINRFLTGVEIHPGAKIGRRVFIDHGMGLVIGEMAEVGDDCLIYKGVVLGGTSLEKKKRHPTLGKCVTVGSNACVLGPITIGDGSRIGCCSVVVKSVQPGTTVVGVPARAVEHHEDVTVDLHHEKLEDPIAVVAAGLLEMLENVDKRVQTLEKAQGIPTPDTICVHCKGRKFFSGDQVEKKVMAEILPAACPANSVAAPSSSGSSESGQTD